MQRWCAYFPKQLSQSRADGKRAALNTVVTCVRGHSMAWVYQSFPTEGTIPGEKMQGYLGLRSGNTSFSIHEYVQWIQATVCFSKFPWAFTFLLHFYDSKICRISHCQAMLIRPYRFSPITNQGRCTITQSYRLFALQVPQYLHRLGLLHL